MDGQRLQIAAWFLWLSLAGAVQALPGEPASPGPVAAQLVADTGSVRPGQAFTLGVRLRLADGWHVYWKNPGSSGLPPEIRFRLPDGFTAGPLQWPLPVRFRQPDGEESVGYEREVLLAARILVPQDLGGRSTVEFGADCRWMACRDLCRLGRADLRLVLPLSTGITDGEGGFAPWRDTLPADAGEAGCWVVVRMEGSMGDAGDHGEFRIGLNWVQPPQSVDWYPVPADALEVSDVRLAGEGTRWVLQFAVRTLAGQRWEGDILDSLLVFVDAAGRRRGIDWPLRLRGKSPGGQPSR